MVFDLNRTGKHGKNLTGQVIPRKQPEQRFPNNMFLVLKISMKITVNEYLMIYFVIFVDCSSSTKRSILSSFQQFESTDPCSQFLP